MTSFNYRTTRVELFLSYCRVFFVTVITDAIIVIVHNYVYLPHYIVAFFLDICTLSVTIVDYARIYASYVEADTFPPCPVQFV